MASIKEPEPSFRPIGAYAAIGDTRTVALVDDRGEIGWLCAPTFDGASVFASILDPNVGGAFSIRPVGEASVERRYLPKTNVLETTFRTGSGVVRLTDCMPLRSGDEAERSLRPRHETLRRIECLEGSVKIELRCAPRPDYARARPRPAHRGECGVCFAWGRLMLTLRSDMPLTIDREERLAMARQTLRQGDVRWASFAIDDEAPEVLAPLGEPARRRLEQSRRTWEEWMNVCGYDGFAEEHVRRSALALRMMIFSPSGAVVAAPTTSLPETIGGERNWDYRYCWLRDAALVMNALLSLCYPREADAFLGWLLHATALTAPRLIPLYNVWGETRVNEYQLDHLRGYRDSRPVRGGNDAVGQLQIDVYGSVIAAAHTAYRSGAGIDPMERRLLVRMGELLCDLWPQPDEGIWEPRSGRKHHTYSKVMSYVGFECLIDLHENNGLDAPVDRFRACRDSLRERIESRAWNESVGAYTAYEGAETLDAAVLQMFTHAFADPKSHRMQSTLDRILERLGDGHLIKRYEGVDDGLAGEEGAFVLCCFWAVEALAVSGRIDEAVDRFHKLCGHMNDVGLMAEEIDVRTGEALGNFPQAFSHVGLINAAAAIDRARRGEAADAKRTDLMREGAEASS